jgi:hypothetical protein
LKFQASAVGLEEDEFIGLNLKNLIQKCNDFVTFTRTNQGASLLEKAQKKLNPNQKTKKLIKVFIFNYNFIFKLLFQPICTRWNSTLAMLNSIREQKKAIQLMQSNAEEQNQIPSRKRRIGGEMRANQMDFPKFDMFEFGALKNICTALKPFETATKKFSTEISTASCILPTIFGLKQHLTAQSNRNPNPAAILVDQLLSEITLRLEKFRDHNLLWFCTLMDPRFAYCKKIALDWKDFEELFIQFCIESNYFFINYI